MPKFEKQYVHFMWDDELEGKKGFFSDDIVTLCTDVTHNDRNWYGSAYSGAEDPYQFKCGGEGCSFHFFYHDPYYDLKVAHEQGKTIQYCVSGEWDDLHEPIWNDELERYRIKPDEPNRTTVTNRELAQWLAQGKGEFAYLTEHGTYMDCYNSINYSYDTDNWDVQDNIRVRKWEDTEWHSPTREYMGLEEWW